MVGADELQRNLINRIALGDIFRRRATGRSDKVAIRQYLDYGSDFVDITYKQLNDKLNQFVRAMREKGFGKGDKIALLASNSINFYIALLGCYKGGFVAVPINYLINGNDLAYIIEHAEAKAILIDAGLLSKIENIIGQASSPLVITLSGTSATGGFADLDALLDGQNPAEVEDVILLDDDPAQIMYTSGTTSRPKGVVSTHKNLFLSSVNSLLLANIKPNKTNQYVALPLFHMAGLAFSLLTLHAGGKVVLVPGFDAEHALDIFRRDRISVTMLIPMMWRSILDVHSGEKSDYCLDCAFYGMAPMDKATLEQLINAFDCQVLQASGQTEITGACTALDHQWTFEKRGNYWGDGSIFCDQAILDDDGNRLPAREIGEIVWRSPLVMSEYFKNESATEEVQLYGWHHSGDLGFIDEDNQLCFVDRKKDIVKTGGENVSSVLVEQVLLGVGQIENAAVIGVPHPKWGEALVGVVSLRAGSSEISEESVIAHCKASLGGFQVPKKVIFEQQIPVTATGKLRKVELRERYRDLFR